MGTLDVVDLADTDLSKVFVCVWYYIICTYVYVLQTQPFYILQIGVPLPVYNIICGVFAYGTLGIQQCISNTSPESAGCVEWGG